MEGSSFFQRLKSGLTKSRESWAQKIGDMFQNRRWDEASLEAMEENLIAADVGVKATQKLMNLLRNHRRENRRSIPFSGQKSTYGRG